MLLAAVLSVVIGSAIVTDAEGNQKVYKAPAEVEIDYGWQVEVSEDGSAKVSLDDGSEIQLDADSEWEYTEDGSSLLTKGLAKILKTSASSQFYTPTMVIGVRGTVYSVAVAVDGSTSIIVVEGAVEVCNPATFSTVEVSAGEGVEVYITDIKRPVRFKFKKGIPGRRLRKWLLKRREWFIAHPDLALEAVIAYHDALMALKIEQERARLLRLRALLRAAELHHRWVKRRMLRFIKKHPRALKYLRRWDERVKRAIKRRRELEKRIGPLRPRHPAPVRPRRGPVPGPRGRGRGRR